MVDSTEVTVKVECVSFAFWRVIRFWNARFYINKIQFTVHSAILYSEREK